MQGLRESRPNFCLCKTSCITCLLENAQRWETQGSEPWLGGLLSKEESLHSSASCVVLYVNIMWCTILAGFARGCVSWKPGHREELFLARNYIPSYSYRLYNLGTLSSSRTSLGL